MNLTPEQALENLNKAAALVSGTRSDHEALKLSVEILAGVIAENKELKSKAPPPVLQ